MWFFGILGSYPYKVGTLLNYYGINYSKVSLEQLNNPGIYIVSYWAGGGKIHTVAVDYDGFTYTHYNKNGTHNHPSEYAQKYIDIYYIRR